MKKKPAFPDRAAFEAAVDRVTALLTEIPLIESARDHAIQELQTAAGEQLVALNEELKAKAKLCERYATENRPTLLVGEAKSNETPAARYGFRLGNERLKLAAKLTWEKVTELLKRQCRTMWLRTKIEADKEQILISMKAFKPSEKTGNRLGIFIVQDESFYIEPKVESAAPVKVGGAS